MRRIREPRERTAPSSGALQFDEPSGWRTKAVPLPPKEERVEEKPQSLHPRLRNASDEDAVLKVVRQSMGSAEREAPADLDFHIPRAPKAPEDLKLHLGGLEDDDSLRASPPRSGSRRRHSAERRIAWLLGASTVMLVATALLLAYQLVYG